MARPLRIEFAGALYHVTSRGDGQEAIYVPDQDRHVWLEVLGHVCERFNWVVHAYCQMTNNRGRPRLSPTMKSPWRSRRAWAPALA